MASRVNKDSVKRLAFDHWQSHLRSRANAIALDKWINGRQYDIENQRVYSPRSSSDEYKQISQISTAPWAGLIVTTLAQTAYVDGIRMPDSTSNMEVWKTMQRNQWDKRQIPIHRAAIGHGTAYGVVLPGVDPLTGDKMAVMRGRSAKKMSAYYDSDDDEWATFAIEAEPTGSVEKGDDGWQVTLYDEVAVHYLFAKGEGFDIKDWEYISFEEHPFRVPPVARCNNRIDLDGRAMGEIEPVIPLLRSIDQDKFDRLIVQRFGAWKIRYIAGMAKPSGYEQQVRQALALKVEDLLISTDNQTKFGTLDATSTDDFIKSHDADLRTLSAIAQIPPDHLLGLSSNLQAEAMQAARQGLKLKSSDFRTSAGVFHEQMATLASMVDGNKAEAQAFDKQVRWRDTEAVSLQAAADGLFKVAQGLHVPVEMLWERLPGWTDNDTQRAKKLIESGEFEKMLQALGLNEDPNQQQGGDQQESTGGNSDQ